MAALRLTSPVFAHDDPLPARFTADKEGVSPPLQWDGVPAEAKELVLICDDPDGEEGVVTHWVVYGILPGATGLPEGIPDDAVVDDGDLSIVQGLNEFDEVGYTGPSIDLDAGPHRIFFRLFALDIETSHLQPGITRAELRKAVKDHIIARAELVGIV